MHPEIIAALYQTAKNPDLLESLNTLLCGLACAGAPVLAVGLAHWFTHRRQEPQSAPTEKSDQKVSPGSHYEYPTEAAPASARTQAKHAFPKHGDNFEVADDSADIIKGLKSRLN